MTVRTRTLERLRSEFERYAGDGNRGDLVLYECIEKSPVRGIYLAVELLATARPSFVLVEGTEGDEIKDSQYVMRWIIGEHEYDEGNRIWSVFDRLAGDALRCVGARTGGLLHERYEWLKVVQEIGVRTNHAVIRVEPEFVHRQIDFSGPRPPRWRRYGDPPIRIPADYFESPEEAAETFSLLEVLDDLPVTVSGMFGGIFRASVYAIDALLEDETLQETSRTERESAFVTANAPNYASASEDFTSVLWFGERFRFSTGHQRLAVKLLMEAWDKGGHTLSQATIGERIDSSNDRFQLSKVFRIRRKGKGYDYHPAWGTMIQKAGKGIFRLVAPESHKNP